MTIPFVEYNSKINKPTWDIPLILEGDDAQGYLPTEARNKATTLTTEQWKAWLLSLVDRWKTGVGRTATPRAQETYTAITMLVEEFLGESLGYVDYFALMEALSAGEKTIKEVKSWHSLELTQQVLNLFSTIDYHVLIARDERPFDVVCKEWLQERCLDWTRSPDARKYQKSAVASYANWVLDAWFTAVDWQNVVDFFKG